MEEPDTDELLAKAKAEEAALRGKLKIFFGAVAGVGKTYTMLEAAVARKEEGVDVLVGHIETHKRPEIAELLKGLEILPPVVVRHKDGESPELDIDGALKRRPGLVLVDELAHSNAPGSRHLKRWQDIEELLDKGIDVYTTLNVQHCESANDVVAQITGFTEKETIPDTFIENAGEIELVDLPTEELLKRFKDGKVHIGEVTQSTSRNFFQPTNLMALRQLALRYTERSVDSRILTQKQKDPVSGSWNISDKLLVCISPNPGAQRLIRAGKRIASELGVEWIVTHVEASSLLVEEERARTAEMLRFAEKLGAEVVTLTGYDVAETLIAYARTKNITKIIIGKPGKPGLRAFIFGSLVDHLARKCGEIDLYLLSGEEHGEPVEHKPLVLRPFSWRNLVRTFGVMGLCTVVNLLLEGHIAHINLAMVYILGVIFAASAYGRRMSIIASFTGVMLYDLIFVMPKYTFTVDDFQNLFTGAVMLAVGLTIAHVTGQLRRQSQLARQGEARTQVLYDMSRSLSESSYPDELFRIAMKHIQDYFKCQAIIFTPDASGRLIARFGEEKEAIDEKEYSAAKWAFEHKRPAGKCTETLPETKGIYMAFEGSEEVVGVIGLLLKDEDILDPEQFHMLEMFVSQGARAIEGAQLASSALEAEANMENERMRNLILTTHSSELPEPLNSISRTAAELLKGENMNDDVKRASLVERLRKEIDDLNVIIVELPKIIGTEKKE